jgi:hypothetical protein
MVFTIAPIAVRLATFGWQKPMTSDPARTELTVPNDPRLIPAVGAVVAHVADRAGLAAREQEGFAAAAVAACRERFSLSNKTSDSDFRLRVSVAGFPDRIEVTIENIGEASQSEDLRPAPGVQRDSNVDRIVHETRNGRVRTTMIKYCGAHAAGSKD